MLSIRRWSHSNEVYLWLNPHRWSLPHVLYVGVMKLEATKFRPREVVKHVLQIAVASLQKMLTLEGHVADNVPIEVIGDVLRICSHTSSQVAKIVADTMHNY